MCIRDSGLTERNNAGEAKDEVERQREQSGDQDFVDEPGARRQSENKQQNRRPERDLAPAPALVSAQTYPSAADPRSNLKPGRFDAGEAASGMRLVSFSRKPPQFDSARGLAFINSDLAFGTHYVYQGNFAGFTIWDVTDPAKPVIASVVECMTSQGDPGVIGNLLFLSAEGAGNRNDCAKGGVQDPKDHFTGLRIYDVSNPHAPKLIKNVQTCKGSHLSLIHI